MNHGQRQKIAIVGSGISGMVCAYLLHELHDVTVYEAGSYIGGHTNTVDVDLDGERQSVDTGFIVFNDQNYPNFIKLIDQLGVAWQATDMSFGVRCDRSGVEFRGTNLSTMFAQRRNILSPSFYRMIRDILRFNREASLLLEDTSDGRGDGLTVEEYVESQRYSDAFVDRFLIPLAASLWSSPPSTVMKFPIRFVVEFLHNHKMLQVSGAPTWRVIKGGSQRYVEKLTAKFRDSIRLNTPVTNVKRSHRDVEIRTASGDVELFDHVILACHSDQALRLLSDASGAEKELLSAFPYQANEAVLHTDTSILPHSRRAWASWNYLVPKDADAVEQHGGGVAACVTYNMNLLQSLESKHTFCVTLNDRGRIDPGKVIRRINYHHPIFTERRAEAQRRHVELIGTNRTSYCGAYWGYGFHEDGVRSALAVCNAFGRSLDDAQLPLQRVGSSSALVAG